jgi:hypothetical protein
MFLSSDFCVASASIVADIYLISFLNLCTPQHYLEFALTAAVMCCVVSCPIQLPPLHHILT